MNWDYIRGLFDGDGSAYIENNHQNPQGFLVFYSNDKTFLEDVRCFIDDELNMIGKIYLTREVNYRLRYQKKKEVIELGLQLLSGYLHKKDVVEKVLYSIGHFMESLSTNDVITLSYICGFFDADGSVFRSGRGDVVVAFANKNKTLLCDIRKFFDMENKIYILKHNKLPDYVLSVVKKAKVLSILKALRSDSVLKCEKINDGIFWLSKTYKNSYKKWSDLELEIFKFNSHLDVWNLSELLGRSPQAITCKRRPI